jgi:hypothetical protein
VGLQEEGNISFGVVIFVQIEYLGNGSSLRLPCRIEERSKDSFRATGDDDGKRKGRV